MIKDERKAKSQAYEAYLIACKRLGMNMESLYSEPLTRKEYRNANLIPINKRVSEWQIINLFGSWTDFSECAKNYISKNKLLPNG